MKMKIIIPVLTLFFSTPIFGQIELMENKIVVTNEAKVNSSELEYSPAFFKSGIVFISTRAKGVAFPAKDQNINENVMSIYQSKRDSEGYLEKPEPFADELISKIHEGPLTFNSTGNTLFFTRNENKAKAADGKKKLQIYSSKLEGSEWQNIKKLAFNQAEYNFVHPAISIDDNLLYFSSDMPGGFGGMDLYVSEKTGEIWGPPTNLGPAINTSGNEVFPFIHADGTLYFASNAHGGLGGLDIFYSYFEGDEWITPINLEKPFNSNLDDFGLIVDLDNKNGYFSSNRKNGAGKDDIFSFYVEGEGGIVDANGKRRKKKEGKLTLNDENGNPMEGAKISVVSMDDIVLTKDNHKAVRIRPDGENEFVLSFDADKIGETFTTDDNGQQDLNLTEGNYILTITKPGYVPQQILITPDTDLEQLVVGLQIAGECVKLTGEVLTRQNLVGQSAVEVQIVDVDTKESFSIYTNADGVFEYCLPCDKTFTLFADKNGVNSAPIILSTKNMSCAEDETLTTQLYLNDSALLPIAGIRIRLPNIYFNFDDDALRPDAKKDLEAVEELLKAYPEMQIELASHTDSRGSRSYNFDLSNRRSQAVYNHLITKGIKGSQMIVKGCGENYIRNRCVDGVRCSETEHQFNRRTEIVVLSSEFSELLSENNTNPYINLEEAPTILTDKSTVPPTNDERTYVNQSPSRIITNPSQADTKLVKGTTHSYRIIAGTFSKFKNAMAREKILTNVGFNEAQVIKLGANQLYAVCVQQTESESSAYELVRQLEEQGFGAYIRVE